MTGAQAIDLYYDPFDFEIDDNPYPIWKRLREDAPLYHNERFDFVADLGALIPMRTVGYLLGIPEQGQDSIRDNTDHTIARIWSIASVRSKR